MLLPYVKETNGWNIDDEIIKRLWDKLVEDKLHTFVFYDADIINRDDFLKFMQSNNNLPVVTFADDKVAGFAWLNGINTSFAFAHFAFYKSAWGKYTDEIGEELFTYWFSLKNEMGDRIFDTLLGLVPEFNERAIKFVKRVGCVEIGSIPDFVYLPYLGERKGVTILYRKP